MYSDEIKPRYNKIKPTSDQIGPKSDGGKSRYRVKTELHHDPNSVTRWTRDTRSVSTLAYIVGRMNHVYCRAYGIPVLVPDIRSSAFIIKKKEYQIQEVNKQYHGYLANNSCPRQQVHLWLQRYIHKQHNSRGFFPTIPHRPGLGEQSTPHPQSKFRTIYEL